jgi:hypothetical protein
MLNLNPFAAVLAEHSCYSHFGPIKRQGTEEEKAFVPWSSHQSRTGSIDPPRRTGLTISLQRSRRSRFRVDGEALETIEAHLSQYSRTIRFRPEMEYSGYCIKSDGHFCRPATEPYTRPRCYFGNEDTAS